MFRVVACGAAPANLVFTWTEAKRLLGLGVSANASGPSPATVAPADATLSAHDKPAMIASHLKVVASVAVAALMDTGLPSSVSLAPRTQGQDACSSR